MTFEELKHREQLELMQRNASKHRNRTQFKVRETTNGIITIVKPKKDEQNKRPDRNRPI
jgi:hypothetical protein